MAMQKQNLQANNIALQSVLTSLEEIKLGGSSAIIDVLELPIEDIESTAIYRVPIIQEYFDGSPSSSIIVCVDTLPQNPKSWYTQAYFNTQDNNVYGYASEEEASNYEISVGWHNAEVFISRLDSTFGGVVENLEDATGDWYYLFSYGYYTYLNGTWTRHIGAYEKSSPIDIYWNGNTQGYEVCEAMGDVVLVKMSTATPSIAEMIGGRYWMSDADAAQLLTEGAWVEGPGAAILQNGEIAIIYSAQDFEMGMGIPEGSVSNGIWFIWAAPDWYPTRLQGPPKIIKLDSKYITGSSDAITEERVMELINEALGGIENGTY